MSSLDQKIQDHGAMYWPDLYCLGITHLCATMQCKRPRMTLRDWSRSTTYLGGKGGHANR